MSDTFKGWKQSIFQSDHLKHLGNYTLKISVNNSPAPRLSPRRAAPSRPPRLPAAPSPAAERPAPHAGTGAGPGAGDEPLGGVRRGVGGVGGGWAPCDERWENSSLLFPFPRRRLIRQSKQAGGEERAGGLFVKKFLFPHLKKGWGGAGAAAAP